MEDDAAQAEHFQVWDKFWGRPGYGAPRQTGQHKENLMKMLHYPKQVTENYALSSLWPCNFYLSFYPVSFLWEYNPN